MSGSKLSEDSSPERASESSAHPLGLTVHALPEPSVDMVAQSQRVWSGRWKMLVLLLVCAAPVIASYFTYYVVRPEGRRNFGELIDPQRPLPPVEAQDLQGRTVQLPELKGQWLVVVVSTGRCAADCVQQLYWQRQLRESLGKDKDRVDRVWLRTQGQPVPPELLSGLKDAVVLEVADAAVAQWLQPAAGQQLQDHLYVVDPLGNWMMRFPAHMDLHGASKAKKDLERLMRASAAWDKPGR